MKFDLDFKFIAMTKLNGFYPLYFRPDQPCAILLRGFFKTNNNVIEFNHNNKNLTEGGVL